ncbi:MAG: DegV family protein [Filifactoraceae bacterium]
MEKIAILTDSTTDLDKKLLDNIKATVVPLQIIYKDGRTFRDIVDINVNQVASDLDEFEPKTSLPIIQDAIDAFETLEKAGYTHCIGILLSSGLSGTYNMFKTVVDSYEGNMVIEIIDSKSASVGIGSVILAVNEYITSGMKFNDIVEKAKKDCENQKVYFAIETLKYLQKGGRISKVQGAVGSVLDVKPIIEVDEEGKLNNIAKVRGRKKSILKLVELFKVEIDNAVSRGKKIKSIYTVHGNRQEDGEFLTEKLKELLPEFNIECHKMGALLTVHTGEGTIGGVICWEDII